MAHISYEVGGAGAILARIARLEMNIKRNSIHGLTNMANRLRDGAISTLNSRLIGWSPSVHQKSIRNPATWDVERLDWNEVALNCNSEHALAVELGTVGSKIVSKSGNPMPIGLNQGWVLAMRYEVKPQAEKAFLRSSYNNPTITNDMVNEFAKSLRLAIMV